MNLDDIKIGSLEGDSIKTLKEQGIDVDSIAAMTESKDWVKEEIDSFADEHDGKVLWKSSSLVKNDLKGLISRIQEETLRRASDRVLKLRTDYRCAACTGHKSINHNHEVRDPNEALEDAARKVLEANE